MAHETEPTVLARAEQIKSILERRVKGEEESRILNLLRDLPGEFFAGVLTHLNLERLVNALDDRRWGLDSRSEFLRLLQPHLSHLNVHLKALLIRSLARAGYHLATEKMLVDLFRSTHGSNLSELKLAVDVATDGWDLLHILYNFVRSADLRLELLEHFRASAAPGKPRQVRVVSDIDDTIYSSIKDKRYPKGTVYPGVLELLSALSPLPPVFLTARPELVASLFERVTHRQLARYGIERCTVLSGNLPGLFGHRRMAEQKARTLTSFCELFPEYRFLFIGDSGQGDMALAKALLQANHPPIEQALIHKLGNFQPGSNSDHHLIHTFENYSQAAVLLGSLGYLSADQVREIEDSVT